MFSVVDDALASRFEIFNGLLDEAEIVFECGEQNIGDMQRPRFAEDRADRCLRIEQGLDVGIVFWSTFHTTGGTKGSNECILPLHIAGTLEEFNILRI